MAEHLAYALPQPRVRRVGVDPAIRRDSPIPASSSSERAGLGSGLNSATRELGSAVGVAVMGTVMATYGMHTGYRVVAAVVLAGALLTAWWLRAATRGSA
ncbi:hypothetical protein [Nonomuraea gerenzanensis]|uniref:Uncharacterized protein n=1 Tax=Nonomuraea gerenzanensis TaxID=93944 RepID=A0A1M4E6U7_9ACTN|nr:hypothetical protein [Nonomuraea gerenzanensis]UBU16794.1 hypothetical protein LCN96_17780 [Nonomuraea gerenzanensis]SBO94504.1 hypothetical protein BN4615_P4020 [Nonomuraea gerenzanensis]